LIKGRSGGAGTKHLYRSNSSSNGNHILWLSSGTTPNLRHQAGGGGTVTITSSVAIVNDTTWSTLVATWRPGRLELYVDGWSRASSTAAATNTSCPVRHLPLGLKLLDLAGLQRRYRADRVLRLFLDACQGAALARRSVRLPAPMERAAGAIRQRATLNAPLDRHRRGHLPDGVVRRGPF
jgi:Concanavalin A-like lectin/glucanases superfamily